MFVLQSNLLFHCTKSQPFKYDLKIDTLRISVDVQDSNPPSSIVIMELSIAGRPPLQVQFEVEVLKQIKN